MTPRAFPGAAREVAAAIVEALLCTEEGGALVPPPAAEVARVVDDFDDWMLHAGPRLTAALTAALLSLDLIPPAVRFRPGRLRSLSLHDRVEVLEKLENHRVGLMTMMFVAVKIPLSVVAYEAGEPLRSTGFNRPSLVTPRSLVRPS